VLWGVVRSFGNGFANASPTFSFDVIEMTNYYGSATDFWAMIGRALQSQAITQVQTHALCNECNVRLSLMVTAVTVQLHKI
jgi:hypothetical protein